jgi:hypothetical protein
MFIEHQKKMGRGFTFLGLFMLVPWFKAIVCQPEIE